VSIRPWLMAGERDERKGLEAALIHAGRAGDRAALDDLLALHERPLLTLCYGILGHAEDAEDAAQETFLRALRALASFRGDASFRTWLYRIAINVCLNRKTTRGRFSTWDSDDPPVPGASPETLALRQLRIREALARLLPRQRAVLVLKEREGWSIAEIAAAMGWSERQVRHELSRARLALAEWRRAEEEPDE